MIVVEGAVRHAVAAAACFAMMGAGLAQGQEEAAGEGGDEQEPSVSSDGTVSHDRWLRQDFALRVQHEPEEDWVMQAWPDNLVEGVRTTAVMGMVRRRIGAVTVFAGAGVGVATTTEGHPVVVDGDIEQTPTAAGTAGVKVDLGEGWYVLAGVEANQVEWTAGINVGKNF